MEENCMNPTQPEVEKWYEDKKYYDPDMETANIPALVKEARRLAIEECRGIIEEERKTDSAKYDIVLRDLRKDEFAGAEYDCARAERDGTLCAYNVILRRLSSLEEKE